MFQDQHQDFEKRDLETKTRVLSREPQVVVLNCGSCAVYTRVMVWLPCNRRYSRSVLRPVETVRVRRISTREQLPVPRRLRRPRQTVARDHLPAARIQDQISRKLLPASRQPRVCQHQPHLRLLRRMCVIDFVPGIIALARSTGVLSIGL